MTLNALETLQAEHSHSSQGGQHIQDEMDVIKQKIDKRKKKQKKQQILFGGLAFCAILFASLFGYSQYKLHVLSQQEAIVPPEVNNNQKGDTTLSATSTPLTPDTIVKALSKHIVLPQGDPQIAQVEDVAKLKQTQAFFKDAENGDIVVVYETMIYVYRPSKDILIAVSDISGVGQTKP